MSGSAIEPPTDSVPRCQHVSPSPWGPAQCVLPDGHDDRHAYSPSEAIDSDELPIDPDDLLLTRAAELSADVWRMLAELETDDA